MTTDKKTLDDLCINAIRFLAVDAIQKADSGHPGLPMGAAPAAYALWSRHLRFNPKNPGWFNRDRFILSAGHGSMLHYALLHLTGFDSVSISDIEHFRQWGSRTPGHPENTVTAGIEVTTGPLGQGVANAVGMAIAEAHLSARFGGAEGPVNHHVYALVGDGCLMEGISSEACSLAGHLGLGRLIVLYDDNKVTIDGHTNLAFSEDVTRRFEAFGWQVLEVRDGNTDLDAIDAAIRAAKAETARPSLIRVHTTIAYGSPGKADTSDAHGAPLGAAEIEATRAALGWPHAPFVVPDEVRSHMAAAGRAGAELEAAWNDRLGSWRASQPELAAQFDSISTGTLPEGWAEGLPTCAPSDKKDATRGHSGKCLNALARTVPGLLGGSADLAPSNKTLIKGSPDFAVGAYEGRNIRFGVREHAMAAICNGIALHTRGLVPYCATFLVFADYMRNAIRMSALSEARVLYVMTHDSVAVGEDGPTHQPVEHLASLRAIPGLLVMRPADGNETSGAYEAAVSETRRPSLLALSRQNVPNLAGTSVEGVARGAYTVVECDGAPEVILIGTGAELSLCVEAATALAKGGKKARVVSMPCCELFDEQDEAYRESVLPKAVRRRVVVEAGSSFGWHRYATDEGAIIGIDRFGASAPGDTCLAKFGYTLENVLAAASRLL